MSLRVLIVDDYPDSADCTSMLLKTLGCQTQVAYQADAVFEAAAEFRPQLFIIDLGMPGTDGFALARQLRQSPMFSNCLLAAYTGYQQYRHEAEQAGFDTYLLKPITMESLKQLLGKLIPGVR